MRRALGADCHEDTVATNAISAEEDGVEDMLINYLSRCLRT